MAASTKIVMEFEAESGKTVTMSYGYASPSASASDVKALVTGLITNGSIFLDPPVSAKSAKLVKTTETIYNLDE